MLLLFHVHLKMNEETVHSIVRVINIYIFTVGGRIYK